MQRLENVNGRARLTVDSYEDLLRARGLPEWAFVSEEPPIVECDENMLHTIGLEATSDDMRWAKLAPHLFDYQRWVLERALERERFAAFLTTGLGKTAIQLEWARLVQRQHGGRTLIVAPLNIVGQTIEEAERFYTPRQLHLVDLRDSATFRDWCENGTGIGITNYEKIDYATAPIGVQAVALDESSILKDCNGARRHALVHAFRGVRWKLACSATPAPNDRIEYAEHAYWLETVRSTREFLAAYFVQRDGNWQLKAHGVDAFYRHIASWSVFMVHPEAFRFADASDALPPLDVSYPHIEVTAEQMEQARAHEAGEQASLFGATPGGITSRTKMLQIANGFTYGDETERFHSNKPLWIAECANVTHADEQVIVWVKFDEEGDALAALIPDALHLSGKTKVPERDRIIEEFRHGRGARVLILKPSMFGFGLNLQACRVQIFSSLDDSFERYFQCVRRSWRFGQTQGVKVYVPSTPFDQAMTQNVLNKQETYEADARRQEAIFVDVLRPWDQTERSRYMPESHAELDRAAGDSWTMILGDSILHMEQMSEASMDLAVFSPPFANLFTYSSKAADMGNVKSDAEYRLQWKWFAERLLPVLKPGRVCAVHCMDIIRFAGQSGYRHTYDYPSDLRAGMEQAGFIYRARISIDKNPQIQATRTKDQNLLFVTLTRDALKSHPQAGEYVLIFTAPGENEVPVIANDVTNQEWITWAHHIWYSIRETDVLNAALAKEDEDERHICPLQLSLIERLVRLYTNKGETVFSPFAGIGSEGWESLAWDRKFYGVELKRAYFETACTFLAQREQQLASRLPFEPVSVAAE
jgi:DNA modification methylase